MLSPSLCCQLRVPSLNLRLLLLQLIALLLELIALLLQRIVLVNHDVTLLLYLLHVVNQLLVLLLALVEHCVELRVFRWQLLPQRLVHHGAGRAAIPKLELPPINHSISFRVTVVAVEAASASGSSQMHDHHLSMKAASFALHPLSGFVRFLLYLQQLINADSVVVKQLRLTLLVVLCFLERALIIKLMPG